MYPATPPCRRAVDKYAIPSIVENARHMEPPPASLTLDHALNHLTHPLAAQAVALCLLDPLPPGHRSNRSHRALIRPRNRHFLIVLCHPTARSRYLLLRRLWRHTPSVRCRIIIEGANLLIAICHLLPLPRLFLCLLGHDVTAAVAAHVRPAQGQALSLVSFFLRLLLVLLLLLFLLRPIVLLLHCTHSSLPIPLLTFFVLFLPSIFVSSPLESSLDPDGFSSSRPLRSRAFAMRLACRNCGTLNVTAAFFGSSYSPHFSPS